MSKKEKKGFFSKVLGVESIKRGAGLTASLLKDLKSNKKEYIKETFAQALNRNGIVKSQENDHLLKIYKNQKIQFLITVSFASFLLGYSIYNFILVSSWIGALSSVSFLAVSIAMYSVTISYAFRAFQIRYKRLGMLKFWLKTPKEWYPKKITTEYLEKIDVYQKENKKFLDMEVVDYINGVNNG